MNFIESLKKFWGSVGAAPTIVVLIYITGFLVLNTHLASFGITEFNVLSYNSVKSSIIFFSFNSLIFALALHSANSHQTSNNLIPDLILSSCIGIFYGLILYGIDVNYRMHSHKLFLYDEVVVIKILIISFMVMLLCVHLFYSYPRMKNLYALTLAVILICGIFCSIYFGPSVIRITASYAIVVCLISAIVFKKAFAPNATGVSEFMELVTTIIGVVFITCILFGYLIYSEIPTQLGGGRSTYLRIYFKEDEIKELLSSNVITDKEILNKVIKVVYISDKKYYLLLDGKIVSVDIDNVKAVIRQ